MNSGVTLKSMFISRDMFRNPNGTFSMTGGIDEISQNTYDKLFLIFEVELSGDRLTCPLDFRAITPDGKEHYLGRKMLGKAAFLKLTDSIPVDLLVKDVGEYVFKAFLDEEVLGLISFKVLPN